MSEANIGRNSSIPRGYHPEDTKARKEWVKKYTNIDLDDDLRDESVDLKGIIENHVGFLNLPMAVVGPLLLDGKYAQGEFCVPICTVEGTLAMSMNRGMYATRTSGGIRVRHVRQEISRAPFFSFPDIDKATKFNNWIDDHLDNIRGVAESTTNHGKLLRIEIYNISKYVVLDFIFSTANAAGQNMVTIATKAACEYIKNETSFHYLLDSNFASDKKASAKTILKGRGHYVVAETVLTSQVLKRILNTEAKDFRAMQEFGPYASSFAGNQGIQLHISNALAAIYLATGQDVACVAENALGYTQIKGFNDGTDLHVSLTTPSLTVGTVGGGTRLKQQHKNLEMLGCTNEENSSKKFAEIICASSLCLEISLLAAIISGDWESAHAKYGRR